VALLFGASLALAAARLAGPVAAALAVGPGTVWAAGPAAAAAGAPPTLPALALIFLKVGSILFGSGYVLLAFLRPDLVERTGWLGDRGFVAVSSPLIPRLRRSRWAAGFLDGANAASVALMAVVTWHLGRAALVDWVTATMAAGAALLLLWLRLNSAWLVLAGAALGWVAGR
jgi:chromate transporter